MSLSRFSRLAALALLVVTACGPRPALAPAGIYSTPRVSVGFGQPATPVPTTSGALTRMSASVPMAGIAPTLVAAAPTRTAVATALPTFVPTSTTAPQAGIHCDNPLATITSPPMNAKIRGTVIITGTANTPAFSFYKVQYMPEASCQKEQQGFPGMWGELYQSTNRVSNGKLMEWQTGTVDPGVYWLRLLVTRPDGNYDPPCEIRVTVVP